MPSNETPATKRVANLRQKHVRSQIVALAVALVLALALVPQLARRAYAEASPTTAAQRTDVAVARPSTTGQLCVTGTKLTDQAGNPVVLRGVSTHGLQWYPQFVNDSLFAQLSQEWGCNLVRLALYSEDYCGGNQQQSLQVLHEGIEACLANDMYVLVDWHILNDADPNQHLDQALEFFEAISQEYAGVPNVLYENCNEPNGETSWSDVRAYSQQVIPVIRHNSPNAVIIVGTTTYDRDLVMASRAPLDFDNVMYTLHFYVATHKSDLRGELEAALEAGLPVFVTECGLSEASGDGKVDFASAVEWFDLLAQHDVSFAIWSLSNKAETSALVKPTSEATTHLEDDDLTAVGLWSRALIQGQKPSSIPLPTLDDDDQLVDDTPALLATLTSRDVRSAGAWPHLAAGAVATVAVALVAWLLYTRHLRAHYHTYDTLMDARAGRSVRSKPSWQLIANQLFIMASTILTLLYLAWRVAFSVPIEAGWLAVAANIVLLCVEVLGFVESLIHYESMVHMHDHPLPTIADDDYPDVDIFIATYNEPCDLLRRTINACNHLRYPDKGKVHVWVCDDNRRPEMRALAQQMGVGYFDRPDNKGAKAGNLNHALALTSAPYVVTLDADMLVRSDFLLKTIPYFVDAEQACASLPPEQQAHLGLLQTPQSFYDPDVFQHALYSEHTAPNEQDFFYRTIEPAKTSTNSVIYGGSNTVLSRAALEAIGGFYTESITEDFATGLLIESAGFVSLGLGEPLASGRTPHTFREHIKQRTRWGRGVIVTARKLHLMTRKGLSLQQRLSYWSSVVYWHSPIKNLIYVCSPLLYAVLGLPVFACSWLDLLIYWLPMFTLQTLCLRVVSKNAVSSKWSGIHETSVMPHLLVPIVQELLGITLSSFKVTDKTANDTRRTTEWRAMAPFLVLLALSAFGMLRVTVLFVHSRSMGLLVLMFWLARNAYYLLMALFLIDGRDSDGEPVRVVDAIPLFVTQSGDDGTSITYEGVATLLTEHSIRAYLDFADDLGIGERVQLFLDTGEYQAQLQGAVVGIMHARSGGALVHTLEILDYGSSELEYLQVLYDRVPSLPQTLRYDFGVMGHLWRNIAFRAARTVR